MFKKISAISVTVIAGLLSAWCLHATAQSASKTPPRTTNTDPLSIVTKKKDKPTTASSTAKVTTKETTTASTTSTTVQTIATRTDVNPPFSAFPGTIQATVLSQGQTKSGVWIAALRKADYKLAASSETDSNGNVQLHVSPGDYYLYVIDREGRFANSFSTNPPELVTVTANATTNVSIAAVPAKGTISGRVTDQAGQPIPGAWITIMTTNPGGPGFVRSVITADSSGNYTSDLLSPGNYFVGWIDPNGNHQALFAPNSPNIPGATPVQVIAGQITTASGSLPPTTNNVGTSAITGAVYSSQGAPLASARVVALDAATYSIANGTITGADGSYSLPLPTGDYKLAFIDSEGLHEPEWNSDVRITNLEMAASVTAPSVVNATLQANTGSLSGVVTDQASGQPLAGAWVIVANEKGPIRGSVADNNGNYVIDRLEPGSYFVIAVDPMGARVANPAATDSSQTNITGSVVIAAGMESTSNPTLAGPATTFETRMGQPLEEFPFTVMTESPHRPHDPVTDFAQTNYSPTTGFEFILPTVTTDDGLYGRFWLSPEPPTPGALLSGVRFNNASWEGVCSNSIVVFSLLDRYVENNANGLVTGANQGLPNELVGVIFDQHSDVIEMRFNQPVAYSANRFVAAIDAENLPMGQPSVIFPDRITVGSIEWLWTTP